jgi:hypothetical protein
MNNEQLAHVWAQGDSNRNPKGSNMFIDNNVIYSYGYHFPIAKHCGDFVLFTNKSYSNTTSKHIGHVRQAIPYTLPVYTVNNVMAERKAQHKGNYQGLVDEVDAALDTLSRGRTHFEHRFSVYRSAIIAANAYTKAFKLGFRQRHVPDSLDELTELMEAKKGAIKKANAKALKERKAYAKRMAREWDEQTAEWLAGERYSLSSALHYAGRPTLLRLNGDTVQTSRGAHFPLDHAKKAWTAIKAVVRSGEAWKANGHTIKVGFFNIQSISAKGDVVAGCHELKYEVMKDFAEQQGW